MATATKKPQTEHELLLVMDDGEYEQAGRALKKLMANGAPSVTAAFLEALNLASTMVPTDQEASHE